MGLLMKFEYKHTRLNVANYQACKEFYSDVLGFEIVFTDDKDQYTELATGNTLITIYNRERLGNFINIADKPEYDSRYGGVILSFQVASLDDAVSCLKAKGVEMTQERMNYPRWGFISAFIRDPDGNLIELEELSS